MISICYDNTIFFVVQQRGKTKNDFLAAEPTPIEKQMTMKNVEDAEDFGNEV